MLIDPETLRTDSHRLEEVEKASLRLVYQSLLSFRDEALLIFAQERDLAQDKAEDITREAMDTMGVSRFPQRLYGKIDYKRARYVFHPEYALKQALFVDSKAEKSSSSARIQIAQTSMSVRQVRDGHAIEMQGTLPQILSTDAGDKFLTTTIFVKFEYAEEADERHLLKKIIVASLPNGMLQERYNPTPQDGIWIVGPDSPQRGEDFRTRLSFSRLKAKRSWRVQTIPMTPAAIGWGD